jgi:LemA protein
MDPIMITLTVVGVLVVAVILWFIATYNAFVRLAEPGRGAWRQVDVELHRRYGPHPPTSWNGQGLRQPRARRVSGGHPGRAAAAAQPAATREQTGRQRERPTAAIGRLFAVAECLPVPEGGRELQALQPS